MAGNTYSRLESRLVLLAWLNSLFGYEKNRDMLQGLRDVAEGLDAEGRSHVVGHLLARGPQCKVARVELERYDSNIRNHLAAMNRRQGEGERSAAFHLSR